MTQTQYTPGPWHLGSHEQGDEYALCINATRPFGRVDFIARAQPLADYEEQAEANARLIAAAPETAEDRDKWAAEAMRLKDQNVELLEAANELKRFGAPGTIGCWCNAGKPSHSPGCKAMRAAIKAATEG